MEFLETNELGLEIVCRALCIGGDCYMGNIFTTAFQMFFPLVNPCHPLKALPGQKRGCSVVCPPTPTPSSGSGGGVLRCRRWVRSPFTEWPELNHPGAQNHHPRHSCQHGCLEICLFPATTTTTTQKTLSTGHSLCLKT